LAKTKTKPPVGTAETTSLIGNFVTSRQTYNREDQKQLLFNESLLKCIVLDSLPLNLSEGKGFVQMIKKLDPKLNTHGRTTNTRKLSRKFDEVI
jgi:hypothetical protein